MAGRQNICPTPSTCWDQKKKCKIGGDLPGRSRAETFFHRYPSVETRDIKLMIKIKINQLIKKKKNHTQNCYSSIYTDSFLCGIDSLIIIKLSYILNTPSSFQSKHTNSSQYLSTCLMEYYQEWIPYVETFYNTPPFILCSLFTNNFYLHSLFLTYLYELSKIVGARCHMEIKSLKPIYFQYLFVAYTLVFGIYSF